MNRLRRLLAIVLLGALGLGAGNSVAQNYPSKPVRIVVPVQPGGPIDFMARLIGPGLSQAWKQPVLIDNRPGAGETIGSNMVAKAAPDGYTLLVSASLAIGAALHSKLPYNAATDFVPVTQLIASPQLLVVGPKLPVASTGELVALVTSKSRRLNYGHAGVGSGLHLEMEHFKLAANIGIEDLPGVPYKGAAPLYNAMLVGEVDMAILPLSTSRASVNAGRLRALGVASARRSAALPDVPTIAEGGVTGFEYVGWQGLYAPAKTPRDIIDMIQQAVVKALNLPEVRDKLLAAGLELVGSTPEEVDAKYRADLAKYVRIVRDARIPLQD